MNTKEHVIYFPIKIISSLFPVIYMPTSKKEKVTIMCLPFIQMLNYACFQLHFVM